MYSGIWTDLQIYSTAYMQTHGNGLHITQIGTRNSVAAKSHASIFVTAPLQQQSSCAAPIMRHLD